MDACPTNTAPSNGDAPAHQGGAGRKIGISLVLPAYNEQETIQQAIQEADDALAALADDYEILVVDDGSGDETAAIVRREAETRPAVRLLQQPRNLGYGAALQRGFAEAAQPLVAFTDADCQFDPRELNRLVLLAEDYDIVCGYRIDRQDPWLRKLYSTGYNVLVRLLLGTGVRDCDCALKLFRREVVQSIPLETNGFFINAELLTKARLQGCSIVEVGVTHRPRPRGESTVSVMHALPVAATLARFSWTTVLFPQPARCDGKASESVSRPTEIAASLLLLLVGLLVLLPNLSYPLLEPDETRYAQISLEMAQSGDWITPTLDGEPYLDKPPLLYWMTAASLLAFGESEWAARLPCALAALLTVLTTYALGRRLIGFRAAWCGAVALLMCGGYVLAGRFLLMDGPLTLFTTTALLMGYVACCGSRFHLGWWLAAGVACGLGVLEKGPIAVVLVVPPLLASRWLSNSGARLRVWHAAAFAAPIFLLTAPWFAAISVAHDDFSGYFFWKHHVMRFLNAFDHQEPWWFYVPVLLLGTFPLSLLLGPLLSFLMSRSADVSKERSRDVGFLLIAAAWVVFFFSLSSCKLPTYVLPALPFIGLLAGVMLDRMALNPELQTSVGDFLRRIPRPATIGVLSAAVLGAIIGLSIARHTTLGIAIRLSVIVAAAIGIAAMWRVPLRRPYFAWGCWAAVSLAVIAFTFADFMPAMSRYRSVHREAAQLHALHAAAPVVYFRHRTHGVGLHIDPKSIVYFRDDQQRQFEQFVRNCPEAVIVSTPATADAMRQTMRDVVDLKPARTGFVYLLTSQRSSSPRTAGASKAPLR
ncbi:MAG: glycosyltransferase [Pirellulaceae bacterium]